MFAVVVCHAGSGASDAASHDEWPLGLEPEFQLPQDGPITGKSVALGDKLFFDKNLSLDRTVSCGTCHNPKHGFSNGEKVGLGVKGQHGKRNVPTIVNRLFGKTQFWDGRAGSLEAQALGPLFAPDEMGMNEALVLARMKEDSDYDTLFRDAYGSAPNTQDLARAIAAFERTILCGDSAFDKYEWNGDQSALSAAAARGLELFRGKAKCSTCHMGTNLSDEKFHNLGVDQSEGRDEPGRMAVSGDLLDHGAYKTPTLRAITLTAPYMHDGSLATLQEVIEFYDRGGEPNKNLDEEIKPLELTVEEKADLKAFLESLSGPIVSVAPAEIMAYK